MHYETDGPAGMRGPIYRFMAIREARRAISESLAVPPPSLPAVVEHDSRWTVWEIRTGQGDRHYLRRHHHDTKGHIIFAHAERFYGFWLLCSATGHPRGDACVPRKMMPKDYKYQRAVEGFGKSLESPVPLAEISAMMKKSNLRIMFSDGVTRTFWMLHNRCPSFPVVVQDREAAKLLNERVGLLGEPVSTGDIMTLQSSSASSPEGGQCLSKPAWLG